MLKRVDVAVITLPNLHVNGKFPGGETTRYGLADDGMHLRIHAVQFRKMSLHKSMNMRKKLLR